MADSRTLCGLDYETLQPKPEGITMKRPAPSINERVRMVGADDLEESPEREGSYGYVSAISSASVPAFIEVSFDDFTRGWVTPQAIEVRHVSTFCETVTWTAYDGTAVL